MNRREDITPKMVADLWLAGLSLVAISTELDIAMETARKRLAKEMYPDLPWDERVSKPTRSVTKVYTRMNDGKTGQSDHRAGSIVNSSRLRRRG